MTSENSFVLIENFLSNIPALNNNDVWAEGLLVFYEVFKFLEENVSSQILPMDYHRAEQFEKDLDFFKGPDWKKTYKVRESVQRYLNHLQELNDSNPLLLIPYVYHLYMGLLSGGQILSKKRKLGMKLTGTKQRNDDEGVVAPGENLTTFPNKSILELKNNFRHTIDEFSKEFDSDLRRELIVESKTVFEMNNEVIKSIEGVGDQLRKNLRNFLACCALVVLSVFLFKKMWSV